MRLHVKQIERFERDQKENSREHLQDRKQRQQDLANQFKIA